MVAGAWVEDVCAGGVRELVCSGGVGVVGMCGGRGGWGGLVVGLWGGVGEGGCVWLWGGCFGCVFGLWGGRRSGVLRRLSKGRGWGGGVGGEVGQCGFVCCLRPWASKFIRGALAGVIWVGGASGGCI